MGFGDFYNKEDIIMALFDYIIESSFIHEGLLSSANMKSQLTTVLMKIFNGKTDMANGKDIESALKKVRGVSKVQYMFSIEGDKNGATYYQHRYIIEDNKDILYQIDIWNKPMELVSRTTVKKIYDPTSTKIPKRICEDFIKEYLSLSKKAFVGYASISKTTMGIYMYTPEKGKQDAQLQGASYGSNSSDIQSIINKMVKKYPQDLEKKTENEVSYIG